MQSHPKVSHPTSKGRTGARDDYKRAELIPLCQRPKIRSR
jgi:hypothetical protein